MALMRHFLSIAARLDPMGTALLARNIFLRIQCCYRPSERRSSSICLYRFERGGGNCGEAIAKINLSQARSPDPVLLATNLGFSCAPALAGAVPIGTKILINSFMLYLFSS